MENGKDNDDCNCENCCNRNEDVCNKFKSYALKEEAELIKKRVSDLKIIRNTIEKMKSYQEDCDSINNVIKKYQETLLSYSAIISKLQVEILNLKAEFMNKYNMTVQDDLWNEHVLPRNESDDYGENKIGKTHSDSLQEYSDKIIYKK